MRCDCCPLYNGDTCPESESEYGIEHNDGVIGCKHPRNWVNTRNKEYSEYLGNMGTDMGIENSLSEVELKRAIEICEHMIGLDYKKTISKAQKSVL